MFDHMLEENKDLEEEFNKDLSEKDKTFIKEMIAGPQKFEKDKNNMGVTDKTWPFEGRTKQKAFLYEIVSNKRNGVDVDKWDYFARDCHSLGIGNNFNLNRCIAFSRVIEVNGEQQICYRDKEVHNLYDMFHTRLLLHQRAYQHKTSNIIEYMLVEALVLANKSLKFQGKHGSVCMSETINDMKAYTLLSDDVIHRIIGSNDKKLQESKTILENILKRDLYSFVGEKRFPGGTFVEKTQIVPTYSASKDENADNTKDAEIGIRLGKVDAVKNDFQETLKGKPEFHEIIKSLDEFVVFDVVDFSYGKKDKDPIAYVNFYSKNEPNSAQPIDKDDVSLLLPTQFDEQVVRVYCKKENEKYKVEMMFREWARETKKSAKKRKHDSA
ncbi:deoxynucleoside triphosphate triphosphohydrolase SAMHD1-like [Ruditapes philippinarum]|uniref:deoxynucleoside triphosphate triphosphohydrolase SAMHD1-like n=1 Tax=Ruditapes philippinarum TaxID=129788 RepID=UPI00295C0385|nr:deoxynucleoside triphosphate triphosphohydrolase SAMHD1-like [Ruditapes philippinarum]